MSKQIEALKLALEALELRCSANSEEREPYGAITAIREALAHAPTVREQPAPATELRKQQEPVAWKYKVEPAFDGEKWHDRFDLTESKSLALWKDKYAQPLYTSPPASKPWVELTDEERNAIERKHGLRYFDEVFHDIEAKLKEKNGF